MSDSDKQEADLGRLDNLNRELEEICRRIWELSNEFGEDPAFMGLLGARLSYVLDPQLARHIAKVIV